MVACLAIFGREIAVAGETRRGSVIFRLLFGREWNHGDSILHDFTQSLALCHDVLVEFFHNSGTAVHYRIGLILRNVCHSVAAEPTDLVFVDEARAAFEFDTILIDITYG